MLSGAKHLLFLFENKQSRSLALLAMTSSGGFSLPCQATRIWMFAVDGVWVVAFLPPGPCLAVDSQAE
jgi:hypothetical protein